MNPYMFFDARDEIRSEDEVSSLKKLKSLRAIANSKIEREGRNLLHQLYPLIRNWQDQLSDLRDVFGKEEIEWLLCTENATKKFERVNDLKQYFFLHFVIETGYKDVPDVDEGGKPLLHRNTPLHRVAKQFNCCGVVPKLFEIYDRYDLNYIDESGLTHFHVACRYGSEDIVKKFLELGQDPNCLWQETGDSPLHLAIEYGYTEIVELLLRGGADPNVANNEGQTPLHISCNKDEDEELTNMLFKISKIQPVQVEAKDKLGRTPLQWAVANFMLRTVNVLVNNGADVTSFVYPTESYFGKMWIMEIGLCTSCIIHYAFDVIFIVEFLEDRGYELDRTGALTIMKYFAKYGMFSMTVDLDDESWCNDEVFAREAKKLMTCPNLSFYDLIRLPTEEAAKLLTYDRYDDFYEDTELEWELTENCSEALIAHLGEIVMRGFCRRWALKSILEMTRNKLPIVCCEIIIDQLKNKDLHRIFMAATCQSS